MNKSELIEKLSLKTGIGIIDAENIVNLIFKKMKDALVGEGRIEVRGFGSFVVKHYGSYVGRNPKNGEKITIPPKRLPFFKVGKELKERIDRIEEALA